MSTKTDPWRREIILSLRPSLCAVLLGKLALYDRTFAEWFDQL